MQLQYTVVKIFEGIARLLLLYALLVTIVIKLKDWRVVLNTYYICVYLLTVLYTYFYFSMPHNCLQGLQRVLSILSIATPRRVRHLCLALSPTRAGIAHTRRHAVQALPTRAGMLYRHHPHAQACCTGIAHTRRHAVVCTCSLSCC